VLLPAGAPAALELLVDSFCPEPWSDPLPEAPSEPGVVAEPLMLVLLYVLDPVAPSAPADVAELPGGIDEDETPASVAVVDPAP
jgi:hypothetical protein